MVVYTTKPNLCAKAKCITLTLLPESRSAKTGFNSEPSWVTQPEKTIEYWIYVLYSNSLALIRIASSLSSVIDVEVVMTNANSLALSWDICWYNDFLLTSVALNVG